MNESPLTRRRFLAAAASAGLGVRAALGRETGQVAVGGCAWIYASVQPNHDITPVLDDVFADMKYAGMEGVEVLQTTLQPDNAVDRLGTLAEKHRLPVIGSSFGGAMWDRRRHGAILEEAEMVIGRLGQLGGRRLGVSVGALRGGKERKTAQQFDDQADVLRKLTAMCDSKKIVLNLHNHTYEVQEDQFDLRNTLRRVPDIKLGPDLGWLQEAGVDPASFIRQHGRRLVFLHLRDRKTDGTWAEAMGEGAMDHVEIGKTLREVGFAGYAVIELTQPERPTRPTRESLKMSRQYVRDTMGY